MTTCERLHFQNMASNGFKLEYPPEITARRFVLSIRIRELLLKMDINTAQKTVEDHVTFYENLSDNMLKDSLIASSWNTLCWLGSLKGYAKEVLGACEQAVALGNENMPAYQDSRALARALTGNIDGAISDLEAFTESVKQNKNYDSMRKQRMAWLEKLKSGENPFDEQLLSNLWGE